MGSRPRSSAPSGAATREGVEEKGILSYLEVRTGSGHARRIQAQLTRLIQSFDETRKGGQASGERRYRFTLAFYPLDPDP
jgi:hypothetical protein